METKETTVKEKTIEFREDTIQKILKVANEMPFKYAQPIVALIMNEIKLNKEKPVSNPKSGK